MERWIDDVLAELAKLVVDQPAGRLSLAAKAWALSEGPYHLVGLDPGPAAEGSVVCLSACERELLHINGIPVPADSVAEPARCAACYALRD